MQHFPAFMDLAGRPCLLVGGGGRALAKLRLLRAAGAAVTVVAPALGPGLADAAAADGALTWHRRRFAPGDVAGYVMVVGATGRAAVDEAVARAARAAAIPVNVVDRPDLSSFIVPAIVDRGPVVVGVSTGGGAPLLARRIRALIEALLPPRIGELARFAARFRGAVRAQIADGRARRRFWERVLDGPIAASLLAGDRAGATERMLIAINRPDRPQGAAGFVSLVGAGPGAADLLTLRAQQRLAEADVVIHDRLVSAEVLALARRDAERVYVGKEPGGHGCAQDDINRRIIRHARLGRRVVRLKGGDPFVFGRGGEELEALAAAGVDFEVVPGITAATACAAFAGIPLTHRDHAQACVLITGHTKGGRLDLDWPALARPRQTLAIYMGLESLPMLCARLAAHGLGRETPAAAIENGASDRQRVVVGTLATLPDQVAGRLSGPALILVGSVVGLHGRLSWFKARDATTRDAPAARAVAI